MIFKEGDRFTSHRGRGPDEAVIVAMVGKTAIMVRGCRLKRYSRVNRRQFELPVKFLESPRCGWKREAA